MFHPRIVCWNACPRRCRGRRAYHAFMNRPPLRFILSLAATGWLAGTAWAAEPSPPGPVVLKASNDYLVGVALASSSDPMDEAGASLKLRPMWAFQWGRFRLATGGASGLLSLGRDTVDPGLSTVLVQDSRWSLSTAVQLDEGRSSSANDRLAGLPDIRPTLRGRASLGYALGKRWSWSLSGSQDLLGRHGGLAVSTNLRYHYPVSPSSWWDASVGASWANASYAQARYGIPAEAAVVTGRAAYEPGAGWTGVQLNWGMASAINSHWVVFGGVSRSALQGVSADSPLMARKVVYGANVGLAYRCCR
jgi:MipA family protein